ncbi:MAG: sugar ABC transporter permease [Spirochaetaceae bacterium 4572_59]|nr:MAG: sugar ABC transporter permease [Spirochaetaceae bacterium 4572_59]
MTQNKYQKSCFFYLILLPAVLVMLWLTIYPVLNVFTLSFFKYNYLSDEKVFVGLGNYIKLLKENLFMEAFRNTLVFSVLATAGEVILGIALALLFYGHFRGKKSFMIIAIFPMMVSSMVICAVWKTLYHYDIGLINFLLRETGAQPVGWLIDQSKALFSVVIIDVWQWTPFAFIMMQAAMGSIPEEIFEAAQIDGASYMKTVFSITMPILSDQIMLLIMLRTIDTFKLFGKVYALTQGGPGNSTETLSYYIYREGFSYFNLGKASTASIFVLLVVAGISFIYIGKILKKD